MIGRKVLVIAPAMATVTAIFALLVAMVPSRGEARALRRRAITIDDASLSSLPVLHVAPGMATVIAFQAAIRDTTFVRPADALFQRITRTERTVVVVPKQVVSRPVTLNVIMGRAGSLAAPPRTSPGWVTRASRT